MPGKKKKDKGKGGKGEGGGEGKLPNPPNLDDTRQGALEALLSFKIHGKEEMVGQYEEESQIFKDKNYQLKERNHYLKAQRAEQFKILVRQAKDYNKTLARAPSVDKESVEQALTEKLQLSVKLKKDLKDTEKYITEIDEQLKLKRAELEKWIHFRDVVQDQNSDVIFSTRERMSKMQEEVAKLQNEFSIKFAEVKIGTERKSIVLAKKERVRVSENIASSMDASSKAELSDSVWLKEQIAITQETVDKLTTEVNALEHRNLKLIEQLNSEQEAEMENTRQIYLATNRKSEGTTESLGGMRQASDASSLPSLVNITECTSEQGPGGQAGQFGMKLLSLKGHKVPFNLQPETFHLPPLSQQLNAHPGLPPRTTWPVTNSMLKSV